MATRIPINKDQAPFDDRQKKIWENMEHDMERRRREWEDEIDKMRSEFFNMRPEKAGAIDFDRLDGPPAAMVTRNPAVRAADPEDGKPVIEKDERGQPMFKVRFNMHEYRPEEVNVKMDSNKIIVSAKHEEKTGGSSVSREYNREVNVPVEVDPLALQCFFQPDGFLVFSAPVPAPKYDAIKEARAHSPHTSSVKSSSYQSSSSSKLNGNDGGHRHSPQLVSHQSTVQHQPTKVHHIKQQHAAPPPPSFPMQAAPPPSFPMQGPPPSYPHSTSSSSSSSKYSSVGGSENPDVIVPSFRPPPDINKLLDAAPALPTMHSSPLAKPPPFTTLSSTFPAGPIFPDSTQQIQLSAPTVTSHDGKFQLTMPIDDFKPEDLTVKTQDRKVIICAKRVVSAGNRNHTSEMNREHSLPDNVDPLTVKAFFTDTNMLIVEAPFLR